MLKRDTSGGFVVERIGWGVGEYQFRSGNLQAPILSEMDYQELLQRQENTPVAVMRWESRTWWMFKGKFYWEAEGYTVDEMKVELERHEKLEIFELERSSERFDKTIDTDFLNRLSMDDVKVIVSIRNQKVQTLYNDAKKEYDDWLLKGKSSVQQAAKEFLKPDEDIRRLEEFVGKIPADFIGGGSFESSPVYKKWSTRIEEAKRRLESAKKILGAKAREKFGFPDILVEQEESTLTDEREQTKGRRETIPDDVKMYVWNRDGGKCVKCGSQEKLEFDHIIPLSKGGSNTARNVQLLCETCNRSKGDSIV